MPLDLLRLRTQLASEEGLRLKPYRDTLGKLTIGFGRNLDDCGITQEEALMLLDGDLRRLLARLPLLAPWYGDLDPVRQMAIADMSFNIGLTGMLKFTAMIAALEARDWTRAAAEMRASLWAAQTGQRAEKLARIIETGALS